MAEAASFHFKKVSLHSVKHNSRELAPTYLLPEKYRQQNEFIVYQDIKELWDQEYAKFQNKKGKRPKFENCIYDGVLNIKSATTIDDVKKYADYLAEKFNFQITSIAIHRDEGRLENEGQPNEFCKYNYHAHIMFLTLKDCKERMRCVKKYDLIDMQDQASKIIGLQRTKSKRKHLNRDQYIEYAKEKEAQEKLLKEKEQQIIKAEDLVKKQSEIVNDYENIQNNLTAENELIKKESAEKLTKTEVKKYIEAERLRWKNDPTSFTAEEYRALTALKKDQRVWTKDELDAKLSELNDLHAKRIAALEQENNNLKNDIKLHATELENLRSEQKNKEEQIKDLNSKTDQQSQKITALETANSSLNVDLFIAKEELSKQRSVNTDQSGELLQLRQEQADLQQKLGQAQSDNNDLCLRSVNIQRKVTALEQEQKELKQTNEAQAQELLKTKQQASTELTKLKVANQSLSNDRDLFFSEYKKLESKISSHKALESALVRLSRALSQNFFFKVARKLYERAKRSLFGEQRIFDRRKPQSIFKSERLFQRQSDRSQLLKEHDEQTAKTGQCLQGMQTSNLVQQSKRTNVPLSGSAHVDVRELEHSRSDLAMRNTAQPVASNENVREEKQESVKAPVAPSQPFNVAKYLLELEQSLLNSRYDIEESKRIKEAVPQQIYPHFDVFVNFIMADELLKQDLVNECEYHINTKGENLTKSDEVQICATVLLAHVQGKVEQHEFNLPKYLQSCGDYYSKLNFIERTNTEREESIKETLSQHYKEMCNFIKANNELRRELMEYSPALADKQKYEQIRDITEFLFTKFVENHEDVELYQPDVQAQKQSQARSFHR